MKIRIFLFLLILTGFSPALLSQDTTKQELPTLYKNTDHKTEHGGYAGVSVGYMEVDGQDVLTLGGRAAWIIDHNVAIGLTAKAMINTILLEGYWDNPDSSYYLVGGYGGIFIEPIILPKYPVHLSAPFLIGVGWLTLNEYTWYSPYDWDSYVIVEPGLEMELSLLKFFRISVGASYRYTTNLRMEGVPENLMHGFGGNITFKFGAF
jgi:hypothetical protein